MKKLLYRLFFLLAVAAIQQYCKKVPLKFGHQPSVLDTTQISDSVLQLILHDNSRSCLHCNLQPQHLHSIIGHHNNEYPMILYGINIGNEADVKPVCSGKLQLQLHEEEKGNYIERGKMKRHNAAARAKFEARKQQAVEELNRHFVSASPTSYTNINEALRLAHLIAGKERWKHWDVRILIVSDMRQDTPNGQPLRQVPFASNTTIYLLHHQLHLDWGHYFGEAKVVELGAVEELWN